MNNVKLEGQIKKVLFCNKENNFYIAVMQNDQKICGEYVASDLEKLVDEDVTLFGYYKNNEKYGVQFIFESIEINSSEMSFFFNKILKGFSKKLLDSILKKYTEEQLCEILNNTPSKLLEFKGIKDKKLESIVTSWNKFKHLKELSDFLSTYKITNSIVNTIYTHFEYVPNMIKTIKKNPYILTVIKGIGFRKADAIALSMGIDKSSSFRINAAFNYTLNEYCEKFGNTIISQEMLFSLMDKNLEFSNQDELYLETINEMLIKKEIYEPTPNNYSSVKYYNAEKKILAFFNHRKKLHKNDTNIVKNLDKYIKSKEDYFGFELNNEQSKALELINENNNTIFLIGYAGTGKSTSCKAILSLLEENIDYNDILCIAISGIATRRISQATQYRGRTIQSLFMSSEDKKEDFPYKVILIDEASMINSVTFYQIISKISDDTILIIVGDDGQLPAIGAGDILQDGIKFDLAPICKLTQIYRQKNTQAISVIANDIRVGKVPSYKDKYEDFSFINCNTNDEILQNIQSTSRKYLNEYTNLIKTKNISKALTYFQLITPIKSGMLGTENLNNVLQSIFNPRTDSISSTVYNYKISDKIIHIKNKNMKAQNMGDYKKGSDEFIEKRIFNGQLGIIIKINTQLAKATILYPDDDLIVIYDLKDFDVLISLAYALTIHKTQGMEYNCALIPMSPSHSIMHNTKLLYTAITRAKDMCYIIGMSKTFDIGCSKLEITKRQTVLKELLS